MVKKYTYCLRPKEQKEVIELLDILQALFLTVIILNKHKKMYNTTLFFLYGKVFKA